MTIGYIHFLDLYHYARARRSHGEGEIFREAQRAFRLAVAHFDRVFVPASSFFESEVARDVLNTNPILCQSGRVNLIATEPSLEDHREAKIRQYGSRSPLGLDIAYGSRARTSTRYVPRRESARLAIEHTWVSQLERDRVLRGVDPSEELGLPLLLETVWSRIPTELGEQAFITDHAFEIATRLLRQRPLALRSYMERVIERAYMDSYVRELGAGLVEDLVCLSSPFPLSPSPDSISYEAELTKAHRAGLTSILDGAESDFIAREMMFRGDVSITIVTPTPSGPPREGEGRIHTPIAPSGRSQTWRPAIAILTVLRYEWLAVWSLLIDPKRLSVAGDPNVYIVGWLPGLDASGPPRQVLLTQCLRMNNKSACASVTRLCMQFESVVDVVVSGIAGAVPRLDDPDKDVMLGDAVIVERSGVVDIDHMMRHPEGDQPRSNLPPPSARLGAVLNAIEHLPEFRLTIRKRLRHLTGVDPGFARPPPDTDVLRDYDGTPIRTSGRPDMRIFRGLIGSGDSLVRDPRYRDRVGERFSVMALDMESAGVAEGAYQAARQYFAVRSLVDYSDTYKNDVWHWHASAVAASVATAIVSAVGSSG